MQSLHQKRRLIALGLTVVFGAGLMVALVHRATEIHGYCNEHGEKVHLDHHEDTAQALAVAALLPDGEHGEGVHDCGALFFLTQGLELQQAPAEAADDARAGGPGRPAQDAPLPLSPLTRSPKTSPPRG